MKKLILIILVTFLGINCYAQNSAQELLKTGKDYLEKEQYMYAISKFSRVLKTFPTDEENYDAYVYRAICKRNLKNFEEAIEDLNNASYIFPDNPKAYFLRAEYKEIIKDFAGASGDYSRIIKINSDNADAYFKRGIIQKKLNNKEKACLDFKKAKENGYNKNRKDLEKELSKCD